MKHANKVKKPYVYIPAAATNIALTIAKVRKRLKEQAAQSNVLPMKGAK